MVVIPIRQSIRRIFKMADIKSKSSGKLDLGYVLQRSEDQWNKSKKSLLIDTILRKWGVPSLMFAQQNTSETNPEYLVIDGIQRITSITQFINNEFKLSSSLDPIKYMETGELKTIELGGKKFKDLPESVQDDFLDVTINVEVLKEYSDIELQQQIARTNNGTGMSFGQKLRINLGADIVLQLCKLKDHSLLIEDSAYSTSNWKKDIVLRNICEGIILWESNGTEWYSGDKSLAEKVISVWNDSSLSKFLSIFDELHIIFEANKELKAILVPKNFYFILYSFKLFKEMNASNEMFIEFIKFWYLDDGKSSTEYIKYDKVNTSTKVNVVKRIEALKEAINKYYETYKEENLDMSETLLIRNYIDNLKQTDIPHIVFESTGHKLEEQNIRDLGLEILRLCADYPLLTPKLFLGWFNMQSDSSQNIFINNVQNAIYKFENVLADIDVCGMEMFDENSIPIFISFIFEQKIPDDEYKNFFTYLLSQIDNGEQVYRDTPEMMKLHYKNKLKHYMSCETQEVF